MIVRFPAIEDLPDWHPCRFKPVYYACYAEAVRDALATVAEVRPYGYPVPGIIVSFEFDPIDRPIACVIDYADQVHVDGLVEKALEGWRIDAVFKHKPCDRFLAEYAAHSVPVVPLGYVIGPTMGSPEEARLNRAYLLGALADLRAAKDTLPPTVPLLTRGAFHALGACPERRRLHAHDLDQGEKWDVPFAVHIREVARSRLVLNANGPDDTIDRKIVEFCAVGSAILSSPGLGDLILPRGVRFENGKNIVWVRSPEDVRLAVREITDELVAELVRATRELFDSTFAPKSIGAYMIEVAGDLASSGSTRHAIGR